MTKGKIYFASPFFNKEQVEREERLKAKLRELGYDVFSPKESCHLEKTASLDSQKNVFESNISAIQNCDILFAVTDGKDMGTIWEAGYANGINATSYKTKCKMIIYYCETLGDGVFNLMLAQSADAVITSFEEMNNFDELLKIGNKYKGLIE